MKCQSLFSGKNMSNFTSLVSAELAQRVVKVKKQKYLGMKIKENKNSHFLFYQQDRQQTHI